MPNWDVLRMDQEIYGPLPNGIGHALFLSDKLLATLLLYLSDPDRYNIWVPTTWKALAHLKRISEYKHTNWGKDYLQFNMAANSFRDTYKLRPQEVDWFLFSVCTYIKTQSAKEKK